MAALGAALLLLLLLLATSVAGAVAGGGGAAPAPRMARGRAWRHALSGKWGPCLLGPCRLGPAPGGHPA